jgi:cell filamentation protein
LARYGAFEDPYCQKGSSVLVNKRGIVSATELEAFEVAMFTLRSAQPLPIGPFDPAHYRAIHHHLFQDVYDWAGQYRTVRTAKLDAMFCYPEHIASEMDRLFACIFGPHFESGTAPEEFIVAATDFLAELNAIHPFREGNGRTQLTFLFLLGERAGHHFDLARIRPEEMLAAMVASFNGRVGALVHEIERLLD